MSVDNAKEFIRYLIKNPGVVEKMKGFTQEELKTAHESLVKEGELDKEGTHQEHKFHHHITP